MLRFILHFTAIDSIFALHGIGCSRTCSGIGTRSTLACFRTEICDSCADDAGGNQTWQETTRQPHWHREAYFQRAECGDRCGAARGCHGIPRIIRGSSGEGANAQAATGARVGSNLGSAAGSSNCSTSPTGPGTSRCAAHSGFTNSEAGTQPASLF